MGGGGGVDGEIMHYANYALCHYAMFKGAAGNSGVIRVGEYLYGWENAGTWNAAKMAHKEFPPFILSLLVTSLVYKP